MEEDIDFRFLENNFTDYLDSIDESLTLDYFKLHDDLTEFEKVRANISQENQTNSSFALVSGIFHDVANGYGNVSDCDICFPYSDLDQGVDKDPYNATAEFESKTYSVINEASTSVTSNSCLCENGSVFPGNGDWNDFKKILPEKRVSEDPSKNEINTISQNETLHRLRVKLKESRKLRGEEEYIPDFTPKPPVEPSPEEKYKAQDLKQRNRQSANRSRENEKIKIENLKRTISTLEKENEKLQEKIEYEKKKLFKKSTAFPKRRILQISLLRSVSKF